MTETPTTKVAIVEDESEIREGLAELIDGLMKAVPKESVRLGSTVTRIEEGDGFLVHVAGTAPIRARGHLVVAPPVYVNWLASGTGQ